MIKNHGSTFLKTSLKSKDAIKRSLSTNVEKKSNINLDSLGFITNNLEDKITFDDYFGIFSTCQLKDSVDFSKFENHTFYDSAEAKVNYAFSRIINNFPFEGTYEDYETFKRNLDGFTDYVLDNIYKNLGYLKFEGKTYIEVKDQSGALFTTGDQDSGRNVLDPKNSQFSFDFWVYIPETSSTENQIIFQKKSNTNNGFTCFIENQQLNSANVSLLISNLSNTSTQTYHNFIKASTIIEKNKFNHLCFNVKHKLGRREIDVYLNGEKKENNLIGSGLNIENIEFRTNSLLFGSGSDHKIDTGSTYSSLNINNTLTFSGALDDFRVFHSVRNQDTIKKELNTNIFKKNNLKLYYKFNEPSGNYQNVNVVMDHSGNSLHAKINSIGVQQDYSSLREKYPDINTPLVYEDINLSPVLFPDYSNTITLRNNLFKNAHIYDQNNPNLIFNLFPKQYFDGQSQKEGFDSLYGNINKPFSYREALAGSLTSPAVGNFVSLLLIWARYFDTLKLYVDNYTEIINIDYDSIQNEKPGSSVFLPKMAKFLGFNFTQILNSPTLRNLEGKDLQYNNSEAEFRIRKIQNEIWKRLLINSQDFLRQKGTADSTKSIIRAAGLDPDLFYVVKEKSGISTINLNENYNDKKTLLKAFDFSSRINDTVELDNLNEPSTNKMFLRIDNLVNTTFGNYPETFLSSSEVNALNDSALSGSWEIEGYYRFPIKNNFQYELSQSLGRIVTENNAETITYPISNIIVNKENSLSKNGTVHFVSRPYDDSNAETIYLSSSNIPIFDGNIYRLSVGRRKVEKGLRNKSEYFLNVHRCGSDFKKELELSEDYYVYNDATNTPYVDLQQKHNPTYNKTSKNFSFHVGSYKFHTSVGNLSDTTLGQTNRLNEISGLNTLTTNFQGELFNVNLFTKDLEKAERENHAKYISSVGTRLPHINYNFNNYTTGSNQRLNIQISPLLTDISSSFNGTYNSANILDRTQNLYTTASFEIKNSIYKPENEITSNYYLMKQLDTVIDSMSENNKVRILSNYSGENFTYDRPFNFRPEEDNRFIVEMSNVLVLNKDITTIMSSLDEFNNSLGDSASLFDVQYNNIVSLRNIYFNNLITHIDNRAFYFLYKYMDNLISDLIVQMVPDKAYYTGHNYTIESHILERHKIQYKYSQNRIPTLYRSALNILRNKNQHLE